LHHPGVAYKSVAERSNAVQRIRCNKCKASRILLLEESFC